MSNINFLTRNILSDMKVELTDMFDRNFERKGFFDKKWTPAKSPKTKGSLLITTRRMRRSIRPQIKGNSVVYSSSEPYTALHNSGGAFTEAVRTHSRKNLRSGKSFSVKAHTRKMVMPQRQFIGDHQEVRMAIEKIIQENLTHFFTQLSKSIKK